MGGPHHTGTRFDEFYGQKRSGQRGFNTPRGIDPRRRSRRR
jgi:hypothetical protein